MPKRALVAYVPVLHEGYRAFFEHYADQAETVYILGDEIIAGFDHLRKEIRQLKPELIQQALRSWKLGPEVKILDSLTIASLQQSNASLIVPDEDVSRELIEKHFTKHEVEYYPLFLRWDKFNALSDQPVESDHEISETEFDQLMINRVHAVSEHSSDWWRRVGAVIIKGEKVILSAFNEHVDSPHKPWVDGDPRNNFKQGINVEFGTSIHGEARLIVEAARQGISLEGTSLYVSTFPCPHCAKLIAYAGIKKCYYQGGYGMLDSSRIFRERGVELVFVKGGSLKSDSRSLRPYPKSKA